MRRHAATALIAITGFSLVVAGCGTGSSVREDIDVSTEARTWVEGIGLTQLDVAVWEQRFEETCSAGEDEISEIAGRYLDEDAHLSSHTDGGPPTKEQATEALLLIRGSVCQQTR